MVDLKDYRLSEARNSQTSLTTTHDVVNSIMLRLQRAKSKSAFNVHSVKRSIDLTISICTIVTLAPMFAMIIVLVALDGGPAFYAQKRVGREGRIFRCWKFRTMVVDADERLERLLATDERAREEYETFWKLKDDPRITKLGRFLRRTSIDELPQILNVIKGEMSIVGPRPRSVNEFEYFQTKMPEFNESYKQVLPGLTCLWQVSGRNSLSTEQKGQLDDRYVRNWSIMMDLEIIIATFPVVILGKGAA